MVRDAAGDSQSSFGRASLPAAQQPTVAGAHEDDAPLHQANGPIAQRGGLPWLALETSNAEENFGDLPIRCFGEMAIECAQHENKAITALPSECKRFSAMIGPSAHDPRPEPQRCLSARRQIIIERQDDRERFVLGSIT